MFQEEVLQQAMDDKGFCILPLLNTEAIQSLKQLYEKYVEDGQIAGMYANHNRNEVEKSKLISKEIIDIVEPFLQKKIPQY